MSRLTTFGTLVALIAVAALCAGCTAPGPAQPTPTQTPGPAATVTANGTAPAGNTTVTFALMARDMAFDKSTLSAPAGSMIELSFVNADAGVPHNVAFYTDSTATTPIFVGEIITGVSTTTYTFPAPSTPGSYFFRCDPHPATMTGTFIVT